MQFKKNCNEIRRGKYSRNGYYLTFFSLKKNCNEIRRGKYSRNGYYLIEKC
jgi:hypothetical protein